MKVPVQKVQDLRQAILFEQQRKEEETDEKKRA